MFHMLQLKLCHVDTLNKMGCMHADLSIAKISAARLSCNACMRIAPNAAQILLLALLPQAG